MSNFDEKTIERIKRLEREVERLRVWERPYTAWTNWTPNLDPNGTGTVLSGYTAARYSVSGRTVNFTFAAENKDMTTRGGLCLIGLPVTAAASAVAARMYAAIYPIGGIYIPARCDIIGSSAFMSLHKDFTYSTWAGNETGLHIYISGFYEI